MDILIIGNGIAGMTAANEIRKEDSSADITIASKEYDHFFSRTALMYEYCGQLSRKDLEPYERDHYERNNFKRISAEASKLDTDKRTVEFASGEILTFDKLLLACGSKPVQLPWQSPAVENVGHFVTLQHLEWLKEQTKDKKIKSAAVIGGGLIGIEVVEILNDAGIQVHFLIRDEWFWPIALNKHESSFVSEHMRKHGVNVLLETEMQSHELEGNQVKKLNLSDGTTLDIDLLVVAIGVAPATDWLGNSNIKLSEDRFKAIETNEYLETNIPGIYTAGDCANVTWFNGVRRPEQLWYTGRDQAIVAAKNILGAKQAYQRGTLYNSSKLFDIEYTTAGLVNFRLENITEFYNKIPKQDISQRIVMQNDKVIGFNMLGSRWDHSILMDWIDSGKDLEYVKQNLSKASFDAEFSPKYEFNWTKI